MLTIFKAFGLAAAAMLAAGQASAWSVGSSVDRMTDETIVFVHSDPELPDREFSFEGEKVFGMAAFGCKGGDTGFVFLFVDQDSLPLPVGFYEPAGRFNVRVRFDNDFPIELEVMTSEPYPETIFEVVSAPAAFFAALNRSETLLMEIPTASEGNEYFKFDLGNAAELLNEHCG